jgi:Domain of Unknown Function (DUF928)
MLRALRGTATALVLVTLCGPTCAVGVDVAPDATNVRPLEAAGPTLALSDWPGPRAQEYLPEAARGTTRRLGDEVRGADGCRGPLSLAVLTPAYAGVTIDSQPTLFWFLGADTGARVEVELYGDDGADPLVTATYPDGLPAGFHGLALADHGVRLDTDVDYKWSVAVICDPTDPAGDIVSVGTIRRIAPPPDLSRQLEGAGLERRAELLVEYGIWYDAMAALATLIGRHPDSAQWREDRARLLEQVGLHEAAGYEP